MDTFKNQIRKQVDVITAKLWSLISLPAGFENNNKKYPIIVFIHGSGEIGSTADDTAKLCAYGTPYIIANGGDLKVTTREGNVVEFISLAIQQKTVTYTTLNQILNVIDNDELLKDRVAEIFITGLSLGAQSIFEDHWEQDISKLSRISGFAPYSGEWYESLNTYLNNIKLTKTPIALYWGTQETGSVLYGSTKIPTTLNAANQQQVVTASQVAKHCCWNTPYSKTFKFSNGMSLYEFFASKVAKPIEAPVRFEIAISGKKITEDIEIVADNLKFTYKVLS